MAKERTVPDSCGESKSVQHRWIGKRVSWMFGSESYLGTVVAFRKTPARTALWHIQYDDGDAEDFQLQDLLHGMREHDRRERERKAIQKKDSHKLIFKRRRAAVSVASA